jgi:predicted HTH domain antitoxin
MRKGFEKRASVVECGHSVPLSQNTRIGCTRVGPFDAPEAAKASLEVTQIPGNSSAMQLNLPERVEAALTPKDAALRLAIGMFVTEEATLGQAAEIADIPQADFQKELGKRKIAIHYGVAELESDLEAVKLRAAKSAKSPLSSVVTSVTSRPLSE